jgi:hypothetical protein
MSASIRDSLVAAIRKVVGPEKDVHIIPFQDNADVLDRRTVMVKQTEIQWLPESPNGQLRIDYVLTFISPALDPTASEKDLDQWVPETLADLTMNWFAWTTATKVAFTPINQAYDVACYVLTTLKNTAHKEG